MKKFPNSSRYPGRFSIDGKKLRIENQDTMSSVLFEDISSITYKSISQVHINTILLGSLIHIIFAIVSGYYKDSSYYFFGLFVLIGFIVYSIINKRKWDNVIVETRGGQLLFYSVELGEGINQVDMIENERRKI